MDNGCSDKQVGVTRRAMLVGAARCVALGGLVAGVGVLASRQGDPCAAQRTCAGCGKVKACELAQAKTYREGVR